MGFLSIRVLVTSFAISLALFVFSGSGFCGHSSPVTLDDASRAASTYRAIGEAQYPGWSGAEVVLARTYYDLAFDASAFEFAVQKGGQRLGHIVIGGNRDFPPLIEYSNGPSAVDLGVDRGFVPAEALRAIESGGEWVPVYVGGFNYYVVGPDAVSELVDVVQGCRIELSALQRFSDDFLARLQSLSGTFSSMWDAALSGEAVKSQDDYNVLVEAEGYTWYRGCGPTSGSMVLGYYGKAGYRELDYDAESFIWDGPYTMTPYIPRELADMVADICNVPRSGGRIDDYGVYTEVLAGAIVRVAQAHGYKGFQCYLYHDERDYDIYKDKIDEGDPSVFGITKMDPGSYDRHAIMGCGYNYRNPEAGHLAIVYDTWGTNQRTATQEYFITYRLLTVYSPLVSEQDLDLSAQSYDYGYVNVGCHSDWVLRISNIGALPLLVNDLTCDDPSFYVTTPTFPHTIAAGESVFVNIRFEPTRSARISAIMTIETDDPDPNEEFCEVALTGRGIDNSAPIVRCAGFVGDHLAAGTAGYVTVRAEVYDPDGASDVASVLLFIGTLEGGQISSLELFDDAQHGDAEADDGLFGNQFWVDAAPAGVYVFEIVAEDARGASSNVWPYMRIDGPSSSNDVLWGVYPGMGESGDPMVANIYMAGFDTTSISQDGGGKLVCVADIDDFLDGSSLARAELRFQSGGVLNLFDDGQGDDEVAGDERFTGSMNLGPGYPAGDYLLEIVAINDAGRESGAYPFYVVR